MPDVFISYRHHDAEAVRELALSLRQQKLDVWLDENRIEDFASIQRSIDTGLARSKVLLAWYSSGYPQSAACQWEFTQAFIAGQNEGDPRRRILVVNPEASNTHIHPVELRDAKYRAAGQSADMQATSVAVARHVSGLSGTIGDIQPRIQPRWFGSARGDGSNRFFGRLHELWAIHSGLWAADVPIIKPGDSRPLVRVTGIAGSGKSLLAEVYAIRFGASYPGGIFWLRGYGHDAEQPRDSGQRRSLLERLYRDFALQLKIPAENLTDAEVREQVVQHVETADAYLWVLDDLPSGLAWDEVKNWAAPSGNGRTLITTRSEAFDWSGTAITIGELDDASALALLTHAYTPSSEVEQNAARGLACDLGYHALALELAAIAVKKRGYAGFRVSLQESSRDVMDFAAELVAASGQALPHREKSNLNVSATLFTSIDEIAEAGRDFLRLAAQLAAAPIARDLAVQSLTRAGSGAVDAANDANAAADAADIGIASVVAQSLARESAPGVYLVHTLVSRAMRFKDRNSGRTEKLHGAALSAINSILLDSRVFDVREHASLSDIVEHARTLLHTKLSNTETLDATEAQLFDSLYVYSLLRGDYREAKRIAERLLVFSNAALGPEHRNTLIVNNYMGLVLLRLGDLLGSLRVLEQNIQKARHTLGERDRTTLEALSHKGLALQQLGQLSQARTVQERVLELRREIFGEKNISTATAMNNLAVTLSKLGERKRARELQERVVSIRRDLQGEGHAETLTSLDVLAWMQIEGGDPSGALTVLKDALNSGGALGGEGFADNLYIMHNLAAAQAAQGKYAEAADLFRRVITLRRTQLGPEHLDTLASMNGLAAVLLNEGHPREAGEIYDRVLDARRRVLGPSNPDTLDTAVGLMLALVRSGDQTGRVRELLAGDLTRVLTGDPASLTPELQQLRERFGFSLGLVKQNANGPKRPSLWRRLFGS
jgi:tetratricopeptide (TPR) repeat protein